MNITASLVTYNNPEPQLRQLLQSLNQSTRAIRLIVVDNSPTKALAPLFDGREYYWSGSNLGFGRAHNLAVTMATDSDIHFILNPDVYFDQATIGKLVYFMETESNIACCVPRVLYSDGQLQRLCKLLPNPFNLFARRFMPWLAQQLDRDYELHDFDYNHTVEIPNASGCFMAVRTAAYRKIGGFDSRFFMYLEDVDISRRLAEIGKLVFYPEATIYHAFAKSSYKNKKLMLAHMYSTYQYFNKWGWIFDGKRKELNHKTRAEIKKHMAT